MAHVIRRLALSRRALLRGGAALVALPWLDAMRPALAGPAKGPERLRLAIVFAPNGQRMDTWTPKSEGALALAPRSSPSRRTRSACWCSPGSRSTAGGRWATGPATTRARGRRSSPARTRARRAGRTSRRGSRSTSCWRAGWSGHLVSLAGDRHRARHRWRRVRLRLRLRLHEQHLLAQREPADAQGDAATRALRRGSSAIPTRRKTLRRAPSGWRSAPACSTSCSRTPSGSRGSWHPATSGSSTSTSPPCARSKGGSRRTPPARS